VKNADDRQAIVELSSKCKTIAISRDLVKPLEQKKPGFGTRGEDMTYGGATVYEGGKTPMQYNTPSYYPQSPGWGTMGFGTDCKFS
jgi:transcription elongation factor